MFKAHYKPRKSQLVIHDDPHRFRVVVAHRRFGKTTLAINELIKYAFQNPGRYWYVAPTYKQAKSVAWKEFMKYIPAEAIVSTNKADLTIELISGSEIALKGVENKDKLRGAGLQGVVMDEVQEMSRDDFEKVIQPMLLDTKGWAIFIGTPKGRNYFHELYRRGGQKEHWSSHHFDAYTTGIYPKEDIDELKENLPENIFREEYLAEFLDGEGTVFRNVKECTKPQDEIYEDPRPEGFYQLGVDLARLHDFTVITVVDRNLTVRYFERFQQKDWELQKLKILLISERYNRARIVIDATTMGDPVAQDLQRSGGLVEPIRFNKLNKNQMIQNLQIKFEQNQLTIPDDLELLKELEAYTYDTTSNGIVRYNAPAGYHDDTVISLALAIHQLLPSSSFSYRPRRQTLFAPPLDNDF